VAQPDAVKQHSSTGVDALSPRVSVIIPTYNRGEMLVEAIDSVLAQTFTDFEVIVIDDGSKDQTAKLVEPYLDRITYRVQQNGGVAAARNHGIRLARAEYICFLDSDDKWKPEKLAKQVAIADAHPEYGLIATEIDGFNDTGPVAGRSKASMYKIRNGHVLDQLLFSNWIQTSTVLVPGRCLQQVGAFDEDVGQFGEDWLLWMRIAAEYPIYFVPDALVLYRMHNENLTSHRPELQYQSLMTILDRLSSLPQFQDKQDLIRHARYRIALNRGRMNLGAGNYELAIKKLRMACHLKRLPIRAGALLLRANIERQMRTDKSSTGATI
jgi:glycosyltransferase involved in cell wall biosynthesis